VKCPSTEEMAALYDGTLPKKFADPVRSHLAGCSRCAQEFKVLHHSLEGVHGAPLPPARLINLIRESTVSLPRPKVKSKRLTSTKKARNAHK